MRNLFPPAVMATAFAALIAFMGIGVVDPLLPLIGKAMGANEAQVESLFTTYIAVMSFTMLLSGWLATWLGGRTVLLIGLGLVVVFASLCGLSNSIPMLASMRAGWGLGNAFFTSTALSIIVGASRGGMGPAITLYEAALGLGIASGPLLGGFLGSFTWRLPFFGTAALMFVAFVFTFFLVSEPEKKEPRKAADLFRAMGNPAVLSNALIGLLYSFSFFTILAYSPLTLKALSSMKLGFTYFAWGVLVGISSVFVVNWLRPLMGPVRLLALNLLCLVVVFLAAAKADGTALLWVIVVSGFFCGISNALFTSLAMEVSPFSRSISSGTYNFVRWAGAAVAPVLSGWIGQTYNPHAPFLLAAVLLFIGVIGMLAARPVLERALRENSSGEAAHAH